MSVSIRLASPDDVPVIGTFVRELAEYEKLAHEAKAGEADFAAALFGPGQRIFCEIAEIDGAPAGFSI